MMPLNMDFLTIQLPENLSESEKAKIAEVIKRDELLNKKQAEKYLKLKQEIDLIESKSIDIPSEHIETANVCVRCRQTFGYFFNTGEICLQCGYKVCQKCRVNQAENGFFSRRNTNFQWLCILCHKYNEYLIQTGDWFYNSSSNLKPNDTSRSLYKKNVSRQRSISSSCSNKSTLSGSQIIKLSLFPDKREEIINEIEKVNLNRSTLSKRYSLIKKSKSTNQVNENSPISSQHSDDKEPTELTMSPLSNPSSNGSNTPVSSKSPSLINNVNNIDNKNTLNQELSSKQLSNQTETSKTDINSRVKAIFNFNTYTDSEPINQREDQKGEDLNSITSSECDTISYRSANTKSYLTQKMPEPKKLIIPKIESNSSINTLENLDKQFSEAINKTSKNSSSNENKNLLQTNQTNNHSSNSFSKIFHREKSPSSISNKSKKSANLEQDNDMSQMDQLFANFRESLKINKASSNGANKKSNNSKEQSQSVPTSPNLIVTKSAREIAIEPEEEYIQMHLKQEEEEEAFRIEKLKPVYRNSNHMSITRKNKNFERTVSIKSVDERFGYDSNIIIKGRILISLAYEKKSSNLSVTIYCCENLANVNPKKETCNPYVKVYLVSGNNEKDKDKNMKRKTPVVKNTCNPTFEETLRYTLSFGEIDLHQLWISVWHNDTFGRNKFLGEVIIPLSTDLFSNGATENKLWYDLKRLKSRV